jgi:hypothetical protein
VHSLGTYSLAPLIILVLEYMQVESTHLNVGSKSWALVDEQERRNIVL